MIGLINTSVKDFIIETYGSNVWERVLEEDTATFGQAFITACPFSDDVTGRMLAACAKAAGLELDEVIEAWGVHFVSWAVSQGFDKLLRLLGGNLAEFVGNLNNLHLHLSTTYTIVPPRFKVEDITPTSLTLHYYSTRPGLHALVVGILKGVVDLFFGGMEVDIDMVRSRRDGTDDHDVFKLTYPHQDSITDNLSWQMVPAAGSTPTDDASYSCCPAEFMALHPYHVLIDQQCRVVQAGRVLKRLVPQLTTGLPMSELFQLSHPDHADWSYTMLAGEVQNALVLRAKDSGLTLKGQIVLTHMQPHKGCPVMQDALLLLLNPLLASLADMTYHRLYLNDLPLHGLGRDFVLLAEQRHAEAGLRERFEKLHADMQVANAQLESATRDLQHERIKSDALLYQMLPQGVANALRAGQRSPAVSYPECTILFSDIVGFTTIASTCSPMEICYLLDALYHEFDLLLEESPHMYKVETIGDSYMVVCNVTSPCPDHVDQVIRFAIGMHRAAARVHTHEGHPLEIRVGLHSGPVVAGVVGKRMPRFCLFGDTVNTASRMESHGLPGKVHISAAAYTRIVDKSQFAIHPRGAIQIKGKGEMTTYLVGAPEDGPSLAAHTLEDAQHYTVRKGRRRLKEPSFTVFASGASGTLPRASPVVHSGSGALSFTRRASTEFPGSLELKRQNSETKCRAVAATLFSNGSGTGSAGGNAMVNAGSCAAPAHMLATEELSFRSASNLSALSSSHAAYGIADDAASVAITGTHAPSVPPSLLADQGAGGSQRSLGSNSMLSSVHQQQVSSKRVVHMADPLLLQDQVPARTSQGTQGTRGSTMSGQISLPSMPRPVGTGSEDVMQVSLRCSLEDRGQASPEASMERGAPLELQAQLAMVTSPGARGSPAKAAWGDSQDGLASSPPASVYRPCSGAGQSAPSNMSLAADHGATCTDAAEPGVGIIHAAADMQGTLVGSDSLEAAYVPVMATIMEGRETHLSPGQTMECNIRGASATSIAAQGVSAAGTRPSRVSVTDVNMGSFQTQGVAGSATASGRLPCRLRGHGEASLAAHTLDLVPEMSTGQVGIDVAVKEIQGSPRQAVVLDHALTDKELAAAKKAANSSAAAGSGSGLKQQEAASASGLEGCKSNIVDMEPKRKKKLSKKLRDKLSEGCIIC